MGVTLYLCTFLGVLKQLICTQVSVFCTGQLCQWWFLLSSTQWMLTMYSSPHPTPTQLPFPATSITMCMVEYKQKKSWTTTLFIRYWHLCWHTNGIQIVCAGRYDSNLITYIAPYTPMSTSNRLLSWIIWYVRITEALYQSLACILHPPTPSRPLPIDSM